MSLAAAKRSLRLFDSQEPSKTKKKEKKPTKKADNKGTTIKNSETKIQFLLEMTSTMDKDMEKNLLKKATKGRSVRLLRTSKKQSENQSAFTEEDFQNFAKHFEEMHDN